MGSPGVADGRREIVDELVGGDTGQARHRPCRAWVNAGDDEMIDVVGLDTRGLERARRMHRAQAGRTHAHRSALPTGGSASHRASASDRGTRDLPTPIRGCASAHRRYPSRTRLRRRPRHARRRYRGGRCEARRTPRASARWRNRRGGAHRSPIEPRRRRRTRRPNAEARARRGSRWRWSCRDRRARQWRTAPAAASPRRGAPASAFRAASTPSVVVSSSAAATERVPPPPAVPNAAAIRPRSSRCSGR